MPRLYRELTTTELTQSAGHMPGFFLFKMSMYKNANQSIVAEFFGYLKQKELDFGQFSDMVSKCLG